MQRGLQQVAGGDESAIGDGVEKRLAPIPSPMHSDREPQVADAPKSEAEEQTNRGCSQRANPILTPVEEKVHAAKDQRGKQGNGPETDRVAEREQQVSAKGELLVKRHHQEKEPPEQTKLADANPVYRNACEADGSGKAQNAEKHG